MGSKSRIKTTLVGSYPVPDWLTALPSEQALIDATRVVMHMQEQAGIDVVCDGELSRFDVNHPEAQGMIEYFMHPMTGVRSAPTYEELVAFSSQKGMSFRRRPPGVIEGKIGNGTLDLAAPCARAKSLTSRPFKFTVTGPHMLAKTYVNKFYPDTASLAMAIAEVLANQVKLLNADIVQLDEANLPGSPDEWTWAAEALNKVLDAVPGKAAVHLCFGNYGGQITQKGSWDKLINYLNALHADHLVLELAHRPTSDLAALKEIRPEIGLGIGVIDIKSTEIENPDVVARRIELAEQVLGVGRVTYVHPDCGFWNLKRHIADRKIKALVLGRELYEGTYSDRKAGFATKDIYERHAP